MQSLNMVCVVHLPINATFPDENLIKLQLLIKKIYKYSYLNRRMSRFFQIFPAKLITLTQFGCEINKRKNTPPTTNSSTTSSNVIWKLSGS